MTRRATSAPRPGHGRCSRLSPPEPPGPRPRVTQVPRGIVSLPGSLPRDHAPRMLPFEGVWKTAVVRPPDVVREYQQSEVAGAGSAHFGVLNERISYAVGFVVGL